MNPQPPPLDLDLGCTRGVERRILESLPAIRATRDFDPAYQEAVRRTLQELGRGAVPHGGRDSLVRFTGEHIEELGAELAAADHELARMRQLQREACDCREAIRLETYKTLSEFRDRARGLLGPRRAKESLCLNGDTHRDPAYLLAQTRHVIGWATDQKTPPPDAGFDWSKAVAPLLTLRDDLETAIREAVNAGVALAAPLAARDTAIETFDKEVPASCRLLERLFETLGLPTLAAAVRPHLRGTGRVGRPSKRPPVDEHPDLVEGLRAAGLLPEAEATTAANDTAAADEMAGDEMPVEAVDETPVQMPAPERRRAANSRRARWRFVSGVEHRVCTGSRSPAARSEPGRRPPAPEEAISSRAAASTWTARARQWWQRKRVAV